MIGTSQAAATAAHQEEAIVHRSSDAVTDVLMHMRQLSADSKTMRERGNAIRGNIEQLIVSMQFQDRVSQVLSVVDGDITRLRDQVERDEPAPESAQWLNELERHYTMREQHQQGSSNPHESAATPVRKAVFF